jgi:type II secretory pathway pseudopilin PulG
MFNRLKDQRGFTIVELVITASYTAAASAAIIGIFITVNTLNRQARNLAEATAVAQQKVETYRDAGYTAVPVGTPAETFTNQLPINLGSPKSAIANVTQLQNGLKQVDIRISYTDGRRTKNVYTSTLISQRGINR